MSNHEIHSKFAGSKPKNRKYLRLCPQTDSKEKDLPHGLEGTALHFGPCHDRALTGSGSPTLSKQAQARQGKALTGSRRAPPRGAASIGRQHKAGEGQPIGEGGHRGEERGVVS